MTGPTEAIRAALRQHREEIHEEGVCICGWHANVHDDWPAHVAALVVGVLTTNGWALTELPEANEHNEWVGTDWMVWISRGGSMQVREPGYMSHPIKARQFAAALLAAANAVEVSAVSPTQKEPDQ